MKALGDGTLRQGERSWEEPLLLCFDGVTMQIFVNRPELRDRLVEYYRAYHVAATETPPDRTIYVSQGRPPAARGRWRDVPRRDPHKAVKEAFREEDGRRVVLKKETRVQIVLTLAETLIAGDLLFHFNQVVNLINTEFGKLKMREGYRLLHAAGVASSSQGIALAGAPGAGKSTASLWFLEAGFRFVSNDRLLAKPDGRKVRMIGYPKAPRVNPGTLLSLPRLRGVLTEAEMRAFEGIRPEALQKLERKYDVEVERFFGSGAVQLTGELSRLVLLNWQWEGRGWEVRRLSPEEALRWVPLLHRDAGAFDLGLTPDKQEAPVPEAYREIFARTEILEIRGKVEFARLIEWAKEL